MDVRISVYNELIRLSFLLFEIVVTTLLPVLLVYAIGKIRDQKLRTYVETLVRFAQEKIPAKSDRYNYVAGELSRRFSRLSEKDIAHLIEATVNAIKTAPIAPKFEVVELQPPTIEFVPVIKEVAAERPTTQKLDG